MAELLGSPLVRQWPSLWDRRRPGLFLFPIGKALAEPLGKALL